MQRGLAAVLELRLRCLEAKVLESECRTSSAVASASGELRNPENASGRQYS